MVWQKNLSDFETPIFIGQTRLDTETNPLELIKFSECYH